jgi:hypothetical protein|tara:strand:- start:976 stop:1311 length:336 start_codon:yes stop_codon:yes gene_type:complete
MAIINDILDQELMALNDNVAVSEADRNSAIAEADAAISNWASVPSIWQHALSCVAHFDTLTAAEIAAAVDSDHAAMYSAIEAHGAGITDAQKAELKGRLELIEFADNISHS